MTSSHATNKTLNTPQRIYTQPLVININKQKYNKITQQFKSKIIIVKCFFPSTSRHSISKELYYLII